MNLAGVTKRQHVETFTMKVAKSLRYATERFNLIDDLKKKEIVESCGWFICLKKQPNDIIFI